LDGFIPAGQETEQNPSGLGAGTYEVVINDANSCEVQTTVILIEPTPVDNTVAADTFAGDWNISCNGFSDGAIDLEIIGGTDPFTYAWTTLDGNIPAGQENLEDPSGLTAGTYTVLVTDVNNCTTNATITLLEPPVLTQAVEADSFAGGWNISCNGFDDGAIDLSIGGGTPGYTYVWTTLDGSIPAGQENLEDPSGLTAGTYDVLITDANNCTITSTITLLEPPVLDPGSRSRQLCRRMEHQL
jgi:large repetitive protein